MSEQMTLEDVLSGKEVVEPEEKAKAPETEKPETVEAVEEADVETPEEPAEKPTGDVKKTEPPAVEHSKEVPLAAMLDERDKRKALQAELDAIRKQQQEAETQKIDFWENPEAAIEARVGKLKEDFQQQLVAGRLEMSMQIAKTQHPDFDDALASFKEAAEQNNALVDQVLQSEHPGQSIYNIGKQFKDLDEVGGDLNAMRERIRAEERAKLMEELSAKQSKRSSVPTALTDETSAMAPREKVEGGPTPLGNIFSHNRG